MTVSALNARAPLRPLHDPHQAPPGRSWGRGPVIGTRGGMPVYMFDRLPPPGRFRDAPPPVQVDKKARKKVTFCGTKTRVSDPYCSKPSSINRRVVEALGQFEAAVAAGHSAWLTYTVILTRVTPLTTTDHEAQQLVARHLDGLKRWFRRQGEAFEAGWSLERCGRLGLHVHVVMACPSRLAITARAAVTDSLSRLAGEKVRCPTLKFHCREDAVSTASQVRGWWKYQLKSAVKDGEIVQGIRGELHQPVAAKPRGWCHGAA